MGVFDLLSDLTVKVRTNTSKKQSTGLLIFSSTSENNPVVLTCKHSLCTRDGVCIVDCGSECANLECLSGIELTLNNHNLLEPDRLVVFEKLDLVIISLKEKRPNKTVPFVSFVEGQRGDNCFLRGFPIELQHPLHQKNSMHLYHASFHDKGPDKHVFEINLQNVNIEDEVVVRGLSGSGVFVDGVNKLFLIGMVAQYKIQNTLECLHLKAIFRSYEQWLSLQEVNWLLDQISVKRQIVDTELIPFSKKIILRELDIRKKEISLQLEDIKNRRQVMEVTDNIYAIKRLKNEIERLEDQKSQNLVRIHHLEKQLNNDFS